MFAQSNFFMDTEKLKRFACRPIFSQIKFHLTQPNHSSDNPIREIVIEEGL